MHACARTYTRGECLSNQWPWLGNHCNNHTSNNRTIVESGVAGGGGAVISRKNYLVSKGSLGIAARRDAAGDQPRNIHC
jgi:hypothetical protein